MAGSARGVRELLEVYGAVDAALKDSDRKEFGAEVEKFLPGYSTHPGWYSELQHFLFRDAPRDTPDVGEALTKIAQYDEQGQRLPQPQKARLLYILSIIARLNRVDPGCGLPRLTTDLQAPTVEALAALGPTSSDRGRRLATAQARFDDFASGVPGNFVGARAFSDLRSIALNAGMIGEETALAPLCDSSVVTVDGVDSVVVDSSFESREVTLNNLKRVVNPYNWDENYQDFFNEMGRYPDMICADGWRRVLESVNFFDGVVITTPLKYLPITLGPSRAILEYDLDRSKFDAGDRRVEVDRGYINMSVANDAGDPDQPGVRVYTRKVVHIAGISPSAQQRLVCITGYGTASSDFLLGPAAAPSEDAEPFDFPANQDAADGADIDDDPVSLPRHAVPAAVQVWNDTVMDLTEQYADLATRWWNTGVSATDLAEFGSRVGSRWASAPLTFLDAVSRPRYRGR